VQIDPAVLFPGLAAIVTALAASGATYLAVRRAKSGRINSSEADVLWEESTAIRRELREQVQQLQHEIAQSNARIGELRTENAELKRELLTLRAENADLLVQVDQLKSENVDLRSRVMKGEEAEAIHDEERKEGKTL